MNILSPPLPVPENVIAALNAAKRVVAVAHVKPDGDAYGSVLALVQALRAVGRSAIAVGLTPIIKPYQCLDGVSDIVPTEQYAPLDGDVVVVCDCGALDRIPSVLQPFAQRLPSICIDHHKTNAGFTPLAYIDPAASSTSEMMWRVITAAGWPLSRAAAEALWVGVITDTGRFAYDCVSPDTLRCAADLVAHGVRTSFLNDCVYGSTSEVRLRLYARAIESLQRFEEGRIAVISLSQSDYDACGGTNFDSENFVDIARFIEDVQIAAFLYAGEKGKVTRVSLRTQPPYDAGEFCLGYGGGGHARAAGATLHEPLPQAREKFTQDLIQFFNHEPHEKM